MSDKAMINFSANGGVISNCQFTEIAAPSHRDPRMVEFIQDVLRNDGPCSVKLRCTAAEIIAELSRDLFNRERELAQIREVEINVPAKSVTVARKKRRRK